jgi:hypothetical protein
MVRAVVYISGAYSWPIFAFFQVRKAIYSAKERDLPYPNQIKAILAP